MAKCRDTEMSWQCAVAVYSVAEVAVALKSCGRFAMAQCRCSERCGSKFLSIMPWHRNAVAVDAVALKCRGLETLWQRNAVAVDAAAVNVMALCRGIKCDTEMPWHWNSVGTIYICSGCRDSECGGTGML